MSRKPRFRDPDVTGLVEAAGGLADAKSLIITQARRLNELYREFEADKTTPLERLKYMASMKGLDLAAVGLDTAGGNRREAVIMLNGSSKGKQGQIIYNPDRNLSRILFSIAHEITHTFFPSTNGGIRFREMTNDESMEANELERLCDAGAAELLMPLKEFREATDAWSLASVPKLSSIFGGSCEATVFRLASAHPGMAAAGLVRYRRSKSDEGKLRLLRLRLQGNLFGTECEPEVSVAEPKYRRQSLHTSDSFPMSSTVHWNKSFALDSVVYGTRPEEIVCRREALPTSRVVGVMEAMDAPFQRPDADPNHPDVLFFWRAA